ncbi:MAG: ATP-binding protein [Sterolibacterium sp.]|jgi:PAS domain S-box-containing protein
MSHRLRLLGAILLPFLACGLQWLLWDVGIKPYVWFLFFPAAFFGAWLGGLRGGLASTAVGALLVWFVFIPPQLSFELKGAASTASFVLFIAMGGLFAWVFEHLMQANQRTEAALKATDIARAEITRLYQKTLELDELKSQFFANVSHELRTPLTLIMAPLERKLSRPANDDLPAEARREAEMMLRNARLLYRHVTDLLDGAKLQAGGMRADYARVEFAELVRGLCSNFDSLARERGIAYHIAAPASLVIEADREKLERILLNLLGNAFKFTPDGGAIAVRLHEVDGHASLEVADNGPGVPEAMREAVFERFRQVDGAANRRHGGTGLGLAIVREFTALQGGTTSVATAPGGGALFTVRLPLRAPVGTTLHETASQLDPALDGQVLAELAIPGAPATAGEDAPLVLVVEDNLDMNRFITAALRPRYRIASASDGRAGLEKALALAPDLIIADVMMPVMSGDAMVLALRNEPAMVGVPIVMLTAKADDDLRVKMLQLGVQDYLTKPFAVAELLVRVDGLLAERRRHSDQLGASEARFAATFAQAAVGMALVAIDGRFLQLNDKFCEIVGHDKEALLSLGIADITHPDDAPTDRQLVRCLMAGDFKSFTREKRYVHQNGSVTWGRVNVTLVRKADGDPDYIVGVLEDIQERRDAEDQLRHRNEELERFNRESVDRELRMIDLKRQVNALARELGREPPHALSFADAPAPEGPP